ncbi:MAG TPA: type VI secretion system-associated protein TagF [Micropepsaceae bacterium]|jgi:type VI secretion system protein ImpM
MRAGCFGKIPQRGDFVSSNLPRQFIDAWDEFLREFLFASRAAIGDLWLESYLHGPIWRFIFEPAHLVPSAAAGILMPSVDRVGRYFPFTVAVMTPSVPQGGTDDPWFKRAEEFALETLDDAFDPQTLSQRLEALGGPEGFTGTQHQGGAQWSTLGSQTLGPLSFRAAALPRSAQCTVLLDGDWQRWDWRVERISIDAAHAAVASS